MTLQEDELDSHAQWWVSQLWLQALPSLHGCAVKGPTLLQMATVWLTYKVWSFTAHRQTYKVWSSIAH